MLSLQPAVNDRVNVVISKIKYLLKHRFSSSVETIELLNDQSIDHHQRQIP